jgi:hypothetical protein
MYRARQADAEQNRPHYADPINCPVLAVGTQAYLAFFAVRGAEGAAYSKSPRSLEG